MQMYMHKAGLIQDQVSRFGVLPFNNACKLRGVGSGMQEYHSKIQTEEATAQDTLNAQADNKYDLSLPKMERAWIGGSPTWHINLGGLDWLPPQVSHESLSNENRQMFIQPVMG